MMKLADTASMRSYFDEGHTLGYAFRKAQLIALRDAVVRHESEILDALWKDLHKNKTEAYYSEIGVVLDEMKHALQHLKEWMEPEHVPTPLVIQPSSSSIHYQPKGVVFIIAPWNYPFMLSLTPLIAAISAGNCVVLKPSEEAYHTMLVIEKLIKHTFNANYISMVTGAGRQVVPALTSNFVFNHIFFTGSPAVGKIIGSIAAEQLCPCTLELGGKSPGIVDESANLRVSARRLVWGKFTNAGQTCVAPDYLLLHASVKDKFLDYAIRFIKQFYGEDAQQSAHFGRIVNLRRFQSVCAYVEQGRLIYGGKTDEHDLYIEPTIIEHASESSAVMQDEIFGPVWPVLTWNKPEELLAITRKNRYPLSCYYFGNNKNTERFINERIEFGGGCINNTLAHLGNSNLPFGGIQGSGSGQYHGKFGFLTFSHAKPLVKSSTWPDPSLRYAPYSEGKLKWFKRLMG